jgi:hypothetical protein
MSRPKSGVRAGAGLLLVLGMSLRPALTEGEAPAPPPLQDLLAGLDRASNLYLDTALHFACNEKIVERRPEERKVQKFEYLFVFDKSHGFRDYRTVVRKGQRQQVNPTELGLGLFLERAYMWVLVFNRTRQDKYRYRIEATGTIHGTPVVGVRFEPIPPYQESINDWSGTAWIDPSSYQILRVEAMKAKDLEEQARMEKEAEGVEAPPEEGAERSYRIERVITWFTVTKNGMRFPGTARIDSTLYDLSPRTEGRDPERISVNHTTQTYSKYRFYGVRTFEEVRQVLSPKRKPG